MVFMGIRPNTHKESCENKHPTVVQKSSRSYLFVILFKGLAACHRTIFDLTLDTGGMIAFLTYSKFLHVTNVSKVGMYF